jgi:hypothetical protein
MHLLYLRIVVDAAPEDYSESEQQRLRECITSAPGITEVKTIARHPKGGYSVTAERTGDTVEQIVSHLEDLGYRLVL